MHVTSIQGTREETCKFKYFIHGEYNLNSFWKLCKVIKNSYVTQYLCSLCKWGISLRLLMAYSHYVKCPDFPWYLCNEYECVHMHYFPALKLFLIQGSSINTVQHIMNVLRILSALIFNATIFRRYRYMRQISLHCYFFISGIH